MFKNIAYEHGIKYIDFTRVNRNLLGYDMFSIRVGFQVSISDPIFMFPVLSLQ